MADRDSISSLPAHVSSSAVRPASQSADPGLIRSRNRRRPSSNGDDERIANPPPAAHASAHASESQRSFGWPGVGPHRETGGALGQLLGDSWNQSWTSVQDLATSLLAAGEEQIGAIGRSQAARWSSRYKTNHWAGEPGVGGSSSGSMSISKSKSKSTAVWGPAPPACRPGIDDVGTGSSAEREAALRAARMASVLQSHDGVNGGLDIMGKYKRRNSDEMGLQPAQPEEHLLVYVHTVLPTDTYAGLILRYKCGGDAFKKANGLWSNDSIQIRKWLIFPVDACGLRGRPCDAPPTSRAHETEDPTTQTASLGNQMNGYQDDPLHQADETSEREADKDRDKDKDIPWTHVRWVRIDSFPEPVEIGRIARQAMGYFPPHRKKSITATSSFATPRQSLDLASPVPSPVGRPLFSGRQSSLGSQPKPMGSPTTSRDRAGSEAINTRPMWMRRPGGVGSMGQNVRTPGPDQDYLNTWTKKHIPSFNIDELPSMSVMGSETARLGFTHESAGIAESSFKEEQDAMPEAHQGNGLDKAAAAVENWLRGALSKRPNTPLMGGLLGRTAGLDASEGDLIEMSDTARDGFSTISQQQEQQQQRRRRRQQTKMPFLGDARFETQR